jgi:hypothetical protein
MGAFTRKFEANTRELPAFTRELSITREFGTFMGQIHAMLRVFDASSQ